MSENETEIKRKPPNRLMENSTSGKTNQSDASVKTNQSDASDYSSGTSSSEEDDNQSEPPYLADKITQPEPIRTSNDDKITQLPKPIETSIEDKIDKIIHRLPKPIRTPTEDPTKPPLQITPTGSLPKQSAQPITPGALKPFLHPLSIEKTSLPVRVENTSLPVRFEDIALPVTVENTSLPVVNTPGISPAAGEGKDAGGPSLWSPQYYHRANSSSGSELSSSDNNLDIIRAIKRRETNRRAAQKCRLKQTEKEGILRRQFVEFECENSRLKAELTNLFRTKELLEKILTNHHCVVKTRPSTTIDKPGSGAQSGDESHQSQATEKLLGEALRLRNSPANSGNEQSPSLRLRNSPGNSGNEQSPLGDLADRKLVIDLEGEKEPSEEPASDKSPEMIPKTVDLSPHNPTDVRQTTARSVATSDALYAAGARAGMSYVRQKALGLSPTEPPGISREKLLMREMLLNRQHGGGGNNAIPTIIKVIQPISTPRDTFKQPLSTLPYQRHKEMTSPYDPRFPLDFSSRGNKEREIAPADNYSVLPLQVMDMSCSSTQQTKAALSPPTPPNPPTHQTPVPTVISDETGFKTPYPTKKKRPIKIIRQVSKSEMEKILRKGGRVVSVKSSDEVQDSPFVAAHQRKSAKRKADKAKGAVISVSPTGEFSVPIPPSDYQLIAKHLWNQQNNKTKVVTLKQPPSKPSMVPFPLPSHLSKPTLVPVPLPSLDDNRPQEILQMREKVRKINRQISLPDDVGKDTGVRPHQRATTDRRNENEAAKALLELQHSVPTSPVSSMSPMSLMSPVSVQNSVILRNLLPRGFPPQVSQAYSQAGPHMYVPFPVNGILSMPGGGPQFITHSNMQSKVGSSNSVTLPSNSVTHTSNSVTHPGNSVTHPGNSVTHPGNTNTVSLPQFITQSNMQSKAGGLVSNSVTHPSNTHTVSLPQFITNSNIHSNISGVVGSSNSDVIPVVVSSSNSMNLPSSNSSSISSTLPSPVVNLQLQQLLQQHQAKLAQAQQESAAAVGSPPVKRRKKKEVK